MLEAKRRRLHHRNRWRSTSQTEQWRLRNSPRPKVSRTFRLITIARSSPSFRVCAVSNWHDSPVCVCVFVIRHDYLILYAMFAYTDGRFTWLNGLCSLLWRSFIVDQIAERFELTLTCFRSILFAIAGLLFDSGFELMDSGFETSITVGVDSSNANTMVKETGRSCQSLADSKMEEAKASMLQVMDNSHDNNHVNGNWDEMRSFLWNSIKRRQTPTQNRLCTISLSLDIFDEMLDLVSAWYAGLGFHFDEELAKEQSGRVKLIAQLEPISAMVVKTLKGRVFKKPIEAGLLGSNLEKGERNHLESCHLRLHYSEISSMFLHILKLGLAYPWLSGTIWKPIIVVDKPILQIFIIIRTRHVSIDDFQWVIGLRCVSLMMLIGNQVVQMMIWF